MSFSTAWCANALSICASCGLDKVCRRDTAGQGCGNTNVAGRTQFRRGGGMPCRSTKRKSPTCPGPPPPSPLALSPPRQVDRIEVSRRYLLRGSAPLSAEEHTRFAALVHDRMTEQIYPEPLASFASATVPAPVTTIPVLAHGRAALEAINKVGEGPRAEKRRHRAACGVLGNTSVSRSGGGCSPRVSCGSFDGPRHSASQLASTPASTSCCHVAGDGAGL